jgi:hypothetical protein
LKSTHVGTFRGFSVAAVDVRMEKKMLRSGRMITIALAGVALLAISRASADDAPRSYIASPDVYKVIADNGKTKVILATWQPGQRDNWHSHPPTGVYRLTGCESRVHTPDGQFRDSSNPAGSAVVQAAIPSHSFENRGNTECRIIIVEQE